MRRQYTLSAHVYGRDMNGWLIYMVRISHFSGEGAGKINQTFSYECLCVRQNLIGISLSVIGCECVSCLTSSFVAVITLFGYLHDLGQVRRDSGSRGRGTEDSKEHV
jgi:hypothetical protein